LNSALHHLYWAMEILERLHARDSSPSPMALTRTYVFPPDTSPPGTADQLAEETLAISAIGNAAGLLPVPPQRCLPVPPGRLGSYGQKAWRRLLPMRCARAGKLRSAAH